MFTVLKEKNFPSIILNQVKMYFRDEGEIKTFSYEKLFI